MCTVPFRAMTANITQGPAWSRSTRHLPNTGAFLRLRRGFTLLEIMVVLVIVGILVTLAALSLSGQSQQARMQTASNRLQEIFKLASDEAIVRNLQLGIVVKDHGYRFVRLNNKRQWVTYNRALPLKPHHVHQDITLEIFVKGLRAGLSPGEKETETEQETESESESKPQAVFLSSGEVTPFTVEIHGQGASAYFEITVNLNGDISSELQGA